MGPDDLVERYRKLQEVVGGCHDGYCVIRKPTGMHTNGGCNCLEDLRLHERSRVGHLLRYAQEMADRIEELESDVKAVLRREHDANKKALEHLRRAEKAEICSKNYAEFNHEWRSRAEAAEAKLAKAVEALKAVKKDLEMRADMKGSESVELGASAWHKLRITLAELEEQADE